MNNNDTQIIDKYMWYIRKGKYVKKYFINIDIQPYYMCGNKRSFSNLYQSSENYNKWYCNDGINEFEIEILNFQSDLDIYTNIHVKLNKPCETSLSNNYKDTKDDEVLFELDLESDNFEREQEVIKSCTRRDLKVIRYINFLKNSPNNYNIRFCTMKIKDGQINNELYIICDEESIKKVNSQIYDWKNNFRLC